MSPPSSASTKVAAMEAESISLQAQINSAATKDKALELALEAAQLCMRALRIATDKEQKSDIRSRCQSLLSEAERIKSSDVWRPADLVRSDAPSNDQIPPQDTPGASALDSSDKPLLTQAGDLEQPSPKPVKRLIEPVSTREFSRAEKIILLRASRLNGFQFWPWEDAPNPKEFELGDEDEPFVDTPELRLSQHQLEACSGWKRAKDALPPPSWFPGDRTSLALTMKANRTVDLVQDAATDCSVVASLCAAASRAASGHAKILSETIYPYDQKDLRPMIAPNGKYILRLNFNGCYRKVIIDDRLPVSKTQRLLHIIDRKNPSLLWPALLEKAYLKVRGGYDFPGSNSSTDLWILAGWIPEQVFLQDDTTEPYNVWRRMMNAFRYGDVLVTMGTGRMSRRLEKELGLAAQHDYAVLDLKEKDDQKLVLLKNPWCEGSSWKGTLPQSSLLSISNLDRQNTPSSATAPSPEPTARSYPQSQEELSPGTFWIDWNSVLQHFESIYLNWNPGLFPHRQDIHFSWDPSHKRSAVGSFVNNPQFAISCNEGGTLWLLLCRHFRDTEESGDKLLNINVGPSGQFIGHMSLYVYDRKGQRIHISASPVERGPYVDSPQTLLQLDMPAKTTYTLVVSEQDLPPIKHTFSLIAFSSMPTELTHAQDRFDFTATLESAWTSTTAGGGAHIVTYSSNPQFSLIVPRRTAAALLLETPNPDLNVHIKLVHGGGKRIINLTQRDILVDSGEYRRGSAYAELQELDAGTYTIICSTFEAGQKASFTLRVDSFIQTQLKQLPGENAGRLPKTLGMACFNWGNNKIAAPIIPRRLIKIAAVAKFRSSSGPESRSPVRLSIELGRGPERRIIAVSADGDCLDADGVGIRIPELDVWPEMLSYADMWLVLERMASPAMPGEERFSVEVWCDGKPDDVLQVGVWRKWDD